MAALISLVSVRSTIGETPDRDCTAQEINAEAHAEGVESETAPKIVQAREPLLVGENPSQDRRYSDHTQE